MTLLPGVLQGRARCAAGVRRVAPGDLRERDQGAPRTAWGPSGVRCPNPALAAAQQWKREIDSKVELPNGKSLPVILCGNKVGLD